MKFIQNLSIRNKLLLISLIPLAATFYFLSAAILGELKKRNNLLQVYKDVLEIEKISDLIHDIQEERSYSIAYLASRGEEEKSELFNQRTQTDRSVAALRDLLFKQGKNRSFSFLDSLPIYRNSINGGGNLDSMNLLFVSINGRLTDVVSNLYRVAQDAEIRNLLESHVFLLYGKTYLGRLRMVAHLAILNKSFQPHQFAQFASLKGSYEVKLERFFSSGNDELRKTYQKDIVSPAVALAKSLIDSIFYNPDAVATISVNDWRTNLTAFLNEIKSLEDQSTTYTRQLAEEKLATVIHSIYRNAIITIVVIIVISVLLGMVIRAIVRSIGIMKEAADRISMGDVTRHVPVTSNDEIGDLANSFNRMIQSSQDYVRSAEVIGKGDYSQAISIRSDADTLGIALANMRDNLQKLSHDNEVRTWLLTGASELNDAMRGDKDMWQLSQDIISQITPYMKAQVGAIYLVDNGYLQLTGSYAFHERKGNITQFEIGQGLAGQAALEKKPIIFSEVPSNYVRVSSGLGSTPPRTILVFPFLFDGIVKGVVEIGMVQEVTDLQMQFINLVCESVGIAINASQSRTKMKELLDETQRQSEELTAQQEELRQINDELSDKTNLLEKSEAELKAQQEELQQTNEELEEKANQLEEQKEQLELAREEIQRKANELESTSKYKSEFLANMSHELRTPLNSILILTQLLSENKSKALTAKDIEFAKNIHDSGNDLLNLINEILDLSKVEAGKIEIEIDELSAPELKDRLHQLFNEVARKKNVEFNILQHQEHITTPLHTGRQRLEQILRNLLSNAFKFTDAGGKVELSIDVLPPDTTIRNPKLRQLPKVAVFAVSDTGIGIPEDKQGIVFEAFQQADGSTKRKYGGTGLGLAISRELATALGGELHLYSREGKGTVFTLYLPLQFDASIVNTSGKEIALRTEPKKPVKPKIGEPIPLSQPETGDDRHFIKRQDDFLVIRCARELQPPFDRCTFRNGCRRIWRKITRHHSHRGQ